MAPSNSVSDFQALLTPSSRILALCGAGLSASSGLPTFRGAGGLWRNYPSTTLATPQAFEADPAIVWLFYAWRRHMALNAEPNRAHYALAELGRRHPGFLCLTQNVDGLSQRAGHPAASLRLLHGSLLELRCSVPGCDHREENGKDDPLCPALAPASMVAEDSDSTIPLLDLSKPRPEIEPEDLPRCSRCGGLMRPAVVWFGEPLDEAMLSEIDEWIERDPPVDVILVIGTSAEVQPAASYISQVADKGAVIAVVNPDDGAGEGLIDKDFFFQGDAQELLPLMLEGLIGKMNLDGSIAE